MTAATADVRERVVVYYNVTHLHSISPKIIVEKTVSLYSNSPTLYLASSSPRRRELLSQLGLVVERVPQDVEESRLANESPESFVQRLALEKARAGLATLGVRPPRPVLGADTAVVLGEQTLGKPVNREHALAMLQQLSGGEHRVLSAVAVVGRDDLGQDREAVRLSESRVCFRALTSAECEAYWATGEPVDKAGGYAIQGLAALFVERIEGSYSGVMGLPLFETGELLQQFSIQILRHQ
ncbi:MAG: septum formation inhibitor Maf [Gammaproteobacteria bacterium]|nr:septum formation inhibitor Maf [Gammaproteobacteria bacterium]